MKNDNEVQIVKENEISNIVEIPETYISPMLEEMVLSDKALMWTE